LADIGEKTEKATSKKRKDERKKGHVALSKDIVNVASIMIMFFSLSLWFPFIYSFVGRFFHTFLNYAGEYERLSMPFIMNVYRESAVMIGIAAVPLLSVSILVAVVATGMQTKFLFSQEAIKPKFSKLNPINGFKRMFALKSFVELIKNLIKVTIVGIIVYWFVYGRIMSLTRTMFMDLEQAGAYILQAIIWLVVTICVVFVCIAALDLVYQKWDYEKKIKMSKNEVKEEYKQLEGDPKIKAKIKETQRKFAMSRMMQAVPDADVVIRNPTHYAVALKYDIEHDAAPIVIAKGQNEIALRIIKIAEENDIFISENKPLAQALYAEADLNREISAAFYDLVAEVLAVLYKMQNKDI